MKTEPDKNFRKQFKSMFIRSLQLGFNLDEIRKKLKEQSYPSELSNKLIEELKSDKDIIGLIKRPEKPKKLEEEQPNFFQKLKQKLFKISETARIEKAIKIHGLYYNIIITNKIRLNEKFRDLNEILENPENKKLVNYLVKTQKNHIKNIQKNKNKILKIAKSLVNIEMKKEIKDNINKILIYIQTKNKELNKELKDINKLKIILQDELKENIYMQKEELRKKEKDLQKIINEISIKSPKFKEAVSQL